MRVISKLAHSAAINANRSALVDSRQSARRYAGDNSQDRRGVVSVGPTGDTQASIMTISHDRENDPTTMNTGLGESLLDDYLVFVAARCRPNTVLAVMFDLRVFFREINKDPLEVNTSDVFDFITAQRFARRGNVVRIIDGEQGLAASTIKRRISSVSGLFAYLVARGVVTTNPVPQGLMLRRPGVRLTPLIRVPRPLPRVLTPLEVTALLAALRTHRDRALVQLMLLGGLRRVEALGVELGDLRPGDRRVHIRQGKGGRERIVPVDDMFFAALHDYFAQERPTESITDHVFVVLKGPNRGGGGACYQRRVLMKSSPAPARVPGLHMRPAMSCVIRVSRVCVKPVWLWKRSRPKQVTHLLSPHGSIYTCLRIGWHINTGRQWTSSPPRGMAQMR